MSTGAAGDGLLRGLFEGCISAGDMGVQRRPYHKNCKCALHKSRGHCNHSSRHNVVSYPIRRTWSEGCLALPMTATSPSSSPIAHGVIVRNLTQLVLCHEEKDDEEGEHVSLFCKV
ncbi:hypothetical protein CASFOL_013742 [Castilleja foliolosa]|uniref:Uncharacterized protein n=1 Tax=Castilleja foliolosa TaxID=1961234 RepID=A0ABD3DLI2_9LAMI